MDENKSTTTPASAVIQGEDSPEDVAQVAESAGAEVALAVDAMLEAVATANVEQSDTAPPDASTLVADLPSVQVRGVGENHIAPVSEPATALEPEVASADQPAPDVTAAGVAGESPSTAESVAAGVDAMLASTTELHDAATDADGAELPGGVAGIVDDGSAATESQTTDVEVVLPQNAELHDEAAPMNDVTTLEGAAVVPDETKATSESEYASVDSVAAANVSAPEQAAQEVVQKTPPETTSAVVAHEPLNEASVAMSDAAEAVSASSATEPVTATQDAEITAAASTADEESFGEFENPDDLIKQANEQEQAARAAREKEEAAATGNLTDLDASLAQDAEKAMGADDADGSLSVAAAQPTAAAPKDTSEAAPKRREAPADASAAGVAAPVSKAQVASAGSVAISTEGKASAKQPGGSAAVQTVRRVAKPLPGIAVKVLMPMAVRYERLGAEKHKFVKIFAVGHIVMAAVLWGYLMFGRTTDQSAIEAAANAKAGAVHPIAASLPGSHSAESAGHGHGASEAPSSSHESPAPSHVPAEKHDDAGAHAEKTGHGH